MELQPDHWNQFLRRFPDAHILQTTEWGEFKSAFGWKASWVISSQGSEIGAQVLLRSIFPGITMAYIPKGPIFSPAGFKGDSSWKPFWKDVDILCRRKKVAFLKVEPDFWIKKESYNPVKNENPPISNDPGIYQIPVGFIQSESTVQPRRTIVLDIDDNDTVILGQMKQKTRYNIKLAQKHKVETLPSDDIDNFYNMMEITGNRDQFAIHSLAYFKKVYSIFHLQKACQLFFARHGDDLLAGMIVFKHGKRAWYFYGASNNHKRELMPTYALQWEAIRWARAQGCLEYDLWGIPDYDLDFLEAEFAHRQDQLWGVYRFKRGFGGEVRRAAGAWDRVYNPLIYKIYQWRMKRQNGRTW
jgi:lipid II:glycine glycyltransferase (peptidoglycan interpeptide bridge formation enzyme)